MHRTQSRRHVSYGGRLAQFHRAHGIEDNRSECAPQSVRYAQMPVRRSNPPTASSRLAKSLLAWCVLGALTGVGFHFVIIEPVVRAMESQATTLGVSR
jgi:hypothetical protein